MTLNFAYRGGGLFCYFRNRQSFKIRQPIQIFCRYFFEALGAHESFDDAHAALLPIGARQYFPGQKNNFLDCENKIKSNF